MRFLFVPLLVLGACGSDNKCDPVALTGCDNGKTCEEVTGKDPACFAAVEIDGKVTDLADQHGIAGARVVAVDVNGTAQSNVVITAADGTYKLPIPTTRNADGTVVALATVQLRADAEGYGSFPGTVRQPLPIDLTMATMTNGGYVFKSSLSDIGLLKLAAGGGTGKLHGIVDLPEDHAGVLVVAESSSIGFSAIAERGGDYAILNLPAGHYVVTAYALGHVYTTAETDVATADVALDLHLGADLPTSVAGSVQIVNGGTGTATSVVLFVDSTYDSTTGRGVQPPNFRSPGPGIAPNVTGAFTIDGIPPGKYVAVAAFENDDLVRDPDTCISGTADVHIVVAAGQPLTIAQGFKITGALAVISPGATTAEMVTGNPTFMWADDSGEDLYLVEVFDSFGQRIWMKTTPGVSGGAPSLAYDGTPALQSGAYYQFRVTSSKNQCELSRTEDLRGVFYLP